MTSHGNRIWTRFNYFLTIQSALIGAFFIRPESLGEGYRLCGLAILGIVWSILWFLIAVQDLWFYEDRYEKLRQFETKMIEKEVNFSFKRGWEEKMPVWKKIICFKIPKTGSTTFSVICPFLFILLWVVSISLSFIMG